MIEILVALILYTSIPLRMPDMVGLATPYGPPAFCQGDRMRSGQELDLAAPTMAVNDCRKNSTGQCVYDWDISYWPQWANKRAIVFIPECEKLLIVDIKDTGRLRSAGQRRLGIRDGVKHYWGLPLPEEEYELATRVLDEPVLEPNTTWLEDEVYWVVADFPVEFYEREVLCGLLWPKVAIWVEE